MERTHLKAENVFCVSFELRVQKNTFPLYSFTYFSVLEIFRVPCTNFPGSQVRRNFVRYFRCTLTRVVFLQVTCSTKMLEKETLSFFPFLLGLSVNHRQIGEKHKDTDNF